MARVLVIMNPNAARARESTLAKIEHAFERAGWKCDVRKTGAPGDAENFAREAAADGDLDVVSTYGGDGTMIEAVTGLGGTQIPLGLLPGGTGNVLAGNLRLSRNPIVAAEVIMRGSVREIDLGRYEADGIVRRFAIACGAGFEARLMETPASAKRRFGVAAYFVKGFDLLRSIDVVPYRVTIDGKEHVLPAATLTVANCEEIVPPLVSMHDGIKLDDGLLDVLAVNARHAGQAALAVCKMVTRTTDRGTLITHLRGSEIEVTCDERQPTGLDGEIVGHTPFRATVTPGGLRVIAPDRT